MQEKATIFLWIWRSTVSFSVTCERWGSPFHVANEVIIERTRKPALKPRLAEERKKYQRSLQAFLSYVAHRSRLSFLVPHARDFSRYPQMETSTVRISRGIKGNQIKDNVLNFHSLRSKLFQYSSGPKFAATFLGALNK